MRAAHQPRSSIVGYTDGEFFQEKVRLVGEGKLLWKVWKISALKRKRNNGLAVIAKIV